MSPLDQPREIRDPRTLKPFHLQEEIHGPLNQQRVDELARDIQTRGLQSPIEILPDGTVLCGHHRLAAVTKLGKTEVSVIVRHDLAAATPAEQRKHFLTDNLLRNHHGPLAQARMVIALDDALGEPGQVTGHHRDRLAKELLEATGIRVDGRTISRRLQLLRLPVAMQQLVDDGTIKQVKALRVASMSAVQREELAEAVLQSPDPAGKLDELLADMKRSRPTNRKFNGLAKRFAQLCDDIDDLDLKEFQNLVERIVSLEVEPSALHSLKEVLDLTDGGSQAA